MSALPDPSAPALDASTEDVVVWLLGTGHLSLLDADGRPLGERASPYYRRCPIDEQHRRFGDRRDESGLPCNVAALRQLRQTYANALEGLASFDRARPARNERLLRRTEAATALAPLAALRPGGDATAGSPLKYSLPAPRLRDAAREPHDVALADPSGGVLQRAASRERSVLFKVSLGFREVLAHALMEGRLDADAAPSDDDAILRWADQRGFLIGDAQVCAGTTTQIERAYRAMHETGGPAPAGLDALDADWFHDATRALSELHALAASAAGAARALFQDGRVDESRAGESTAWTLYRSRVVPRAVETLRQIPDAGPLHPSLLYASDEVPVSLRAFLDALTPGEAPAPPLDLVDEALEHAARPVAARLMRALGRDAGAPLTHHAFRRACAPD